MPYTGFFNAFQTIYKEEGSRVFYRGLQPRLIVTVPAAAITWTTYETLKAVLEKYC